MVTKKNPSSKQDEKNKVELKKLNLSKETVRDLTGNEEKQVIGGAKCPDPTDTCQSCFCISVKTR